MIKDNHSLTVFFVEDDDIAVENFQAAMQRVRLDVNFVRARDGEEALKYLRGESGYNALTQPLLMFVDLRMPGMDGFQFLEEVRSDEKWKHSIIFALTASIDDEDRVLAYEKGIAGYIVKSISPEEYALKLSSLIGAYRRAVEFPV